MNSFFTLALRLQYTFLLFCLLPHLAQAQCPTGDVTLSSQAEVNAFPSTCVNLAGRLTIEGADITSLTALGNLQSIGGNLQISNNDLLSSLTGLGSLSTIGDDLRFYNNSQLSTLAGLSSLVEIGAYLDLAFNDQLTNLAGISSLTSIGGGISIRYSFNLSGLTGLEKLTSLPGSLVIDNSDLSNLMGLSGLTNIGGDLSLTRNNSLDDLAGLEKVTRIGGRLLINSNPSLNTLAKLSSLTSIGSSLEITYNNRLSQCSIGAVCRYLANPSASIEIENNNYGCNSRAEIEANCTPIAITITSQPPTGAAVCVGATVTAAVSATGLPRAYQWYKDGTSLGAAQQQPMLTLPAVTIADSGSYSVVVSNSAGSVTSNAFVLTVNQPTVSLSSTSPLSCTQPIVTLTASSTNTGTYVFQNANGVIASNGNSATVSQEGSYSVTLTSNGCSATATTTVLSNTAAPVANLSNNGPLSCNNTPVLLTATSGGSTYVFSSSATQQGGSGGNTATVSRAGLYSVTVTGTNGCTSTGQTTVTANEMPPTPFVATQPTANGLAVQVSGGVGYERLKMVEQINGYQIRQSELNQTGYFLITQPGPYQITVIGTNGCRATVTGTAP